MASDRPVDYNAIHKPVRKKDAMQLLLGKRSIPRILPRRTR